MKTKLWIVLYGEELYDEEELRFEEFDSLEEAQKFQKEMETTNGDYWLTIYGIFERKE